MTESARDQRPTLEMRHISKTFPGVRALSDVQLKAYSGEVLALMGENGAGKSTLMKILSGAYIADAGGEILIDGHPVKMGDPIAAKHQGIAIIYQELSLAPNLTVAENIYLGIELARNGMVDRKAQAEGCRDVLERLGAPFGPNTVVGTLSIAEQQLVEIARALHVNAKILVMDEPTTALSSRETEKLFALVKQLRSEGIAIIYISHRMAEIYELADRVAVLRDGSYVGTLVGERDQCRQPGADDGRPRAERLLQARPRPRAGAGRRSGARGPRHGRWPSGQGLQLQAACRRGAGAGRSGRLRAHRAGPADLCRRSEDQRRGDPGKGAAQTSRRRNRRSTPASPTSPRTARRKACSST